MSWHQPVQVVILIQIPSLLILFYFIYLYLKLEKLCYAMKIKYSDQGIVYELI